MCSGRGDNTDLAGALDAVEDLLAHFEGDVGQFSGLDDAADIVRRLGHVQARTHALLARVAGQVERRALHTFDGHRSVGCWLAHTGKVSKGEAAAVVATASMLGTCDQIAKRHATGELGTPQARALARLHRNPRCGHLLADHQEPLLEAAELLSIRDFLNVCDKWEELADIDGSLSKLERHHRNRRFRIVKNIDGTWTAEGTFSNLAGKALADIFNRYVDAQRLAETADPELAARTAAQRRADALLELFSAAASTPADAQRPEPLVNLVMGDQRAEAWLAGEPDPGGLCETIDGDPVHPSDAIAALLVGRLRRVIYDSAGVVIDLGRESRLFRGGAKDAVILQDNYQCRWIGCTRSGRHCQLDHTHDWAHGGCTCPANGGLLCGFHNRLKQIGFRLWRDPSGAWHFYRPDGSEIA